MNEQEPSDGGPAPLALLLSVQDLDTAITQLEHRSATLPARRELARLHAETRSLRETAALLSAQKDELATRFGHLEEQTAATVARRKTLEDRLYGARGAAGRDLSAIEAEVAQLRARLSALEDDELALLEEQEPLDDELRRVDGQLAALTEQATGLSAEAAEADREIGLELAERRAERERLAARLPEELARRYESLRSRLGGIGAARLIGDRCDGCHLSLPAVEMDRIRHLAPDALVTCEQCGRILVRASAAGE